MSYDEKYLGTYLNDHLAGSIVGGALARRVTKQNDANDYGRVTAEIAKEIREDQAELRGIMDRLGVRQKRARLGLAWVAEKFTRLKPNGQLFGYSPLSRVLELEGLVMGITGKLELWRSLDQLEDVTAELDGDHIKRLAARAESQRDRVEDLRIRAAREAFEEEGRARDPSPA
jgi:hypothetical protein